MENSIVAIIVTFNRKKLLKEAIEALLKQTYESFDIFVIDNASTDGTFEYIKEISENNRVYYMNTGKNLGGAGGFHFGIKEAVTKGYEKIWIMDDDTIPTSTALQELLNAESILHDAYGFLCSDVKWIDGSSCAMNVPNISNQWNHQSQFLQEGLLRVEQCSFVSCFFTAETVKKVGLPLKEFFVWGDDAEYTKRISNLKESYFVAKSIVVHKMNSNIPTDISQDSVDRLFRYKFSYRNMYFVNKKHGTKLSMLLYYYGIYLDIKKIIKCEKKGKWEKIRIIMKGIHDGKKFAPDVEYI